ncbi:putative telomerase Cajal body protein 1 [Apostichopus japonicus]|uniref:WD repeat-containing protein 79 n=1 Tax=Stichopus japonicus TaxID=307972 RepID=A0A2G8LJM2_STIJA|nr:putative telomerase Cajal body protein 1 [Apostichopus japonicus]
MGTCEVTCHWAQDITAAEWRDCLWERLELYPVLLWIPMVKPLQQVHTLKPVDMMLLVSGHRIMPKILIYHATDGSSRFGKLSKFTSMASGVTHLMYSLDGCRIYSGSRMDTSILCWDVRKSNEVLYSMERNVTTNQRMYFDIDLEDHYLVSGNQDGKVTIWDLSQDCSSSTNSSLPVLDPLVQFKANEDTTNGVR